MPGIVISTLVGEVKMWTTASAPSGYLNCDGSAVSRATYSQLFNVIGTTFGPGDGSTTFNLPDFRSRSPMGIGTGSGLSNRSLAQMGGEEATTISEAQMPSHRHGGVVTQSFTRQVTGGLGAVVVESTNSNDVTQFTGGNQAHNTVHPFLGINFIIKH